MKSGIKCPHCKKDDVVKRGSYQTAVKGKVQRFYCKNCDKKFVARERRMSLYLRYPSMNNKWVMVHLKNGELFYGKLAFTDSNPESEEFIFSIKYVTKLDKHYKVIRGYKGEFVFDMKNVLFMEYIKKRIKKK